MFHGLANWFAAGAIPQARGFIGRGGYYPLTIGTELRRINHVFMFHGLANGFAAGAIPQTRGFIG